METGEHDEGLWVFASVRGSGRLFGIAYRVVRRFISYESAPVRNSTRMSH